MKTCSICNVAKELDAFAYRNKAKNIRRAQCKSCISEWDRKNYSRPEKSKAIRDNAKGRAAILRGKIWEYKSTHPCVDCGESDPRMLEFDHLADKEFNIAEAVSNGYGWAKVQSEINKCEVVCANHHRVRTFERAGWKNAVLAQQ